MVTVGTWLSFLANRPPQLLSTITVVKFKHWADAMYWDDIARGDRIFAHVWALLAVWRTDLTAFQAITGPHMPRRATFEFTVASPPQILYTVRNGLSSAKTDEVIRRIELRVSDAFSRSVIYANFCRTDLLGGTDRATRFDESEGETPQKLIMDDADDVDWDALRDDREALQAQ